jgi:hypothetical protein
LREPFLAPGFFLQSPDFLIPYGHGFLREKLIEYFSELFLSILFIYKINKFKEKNYFVDFSLEWLSLI